MTQGEEGKTLLMPHFDDLRKSGLSETTIKRHGIESVTADEAMRLLNRKTSVGAGYVFPYPAKEGGFIKGIVNIRLDTPLVSKEQDKKPRKYVRPLGSEARLYIPFPTWDIIHDIAVPLIITEGEKKALKATQEGFYSIGVSGVWGWSSSHKPLPDFSQIMTGSRLFIIVFDGDKASNRNVMMAQNRLARILLARKDRVKIVDLPSGSKLDDYLVTFGNESFKSLLDGAKELFPSENPVIEVKDNALKKLTEDSWGVVHKENRKKPFMFIYGNAPVRLEEDKGEKNLVIRPITEARLRHHLIRIAEWIKIGRDGRECPAVPSKLVLQDFLATPNMTLPRLSGIVATPIFASDGTLETQPGYSQKTGLYYYPPEGLELIPIPNEPTQDQIKEAKSLILDDLLVDFPFVGDAERAHAVGLLLLPFVRELIHGPTPLHLVEKSTPGTGATLLVRCIAWICTGRDYTSLPEGRDGEEWRKRITAVVFNSPQIVVIDNLTRQLDSSALASVLTSTYWEDRVLGKTEHKGAPVRNAWVATGNNPILSAELARRTIRCRLDAKRENPHLRASDSFKHGDLLGWVQQNRAKLIWAVGIFVQLWVKQGMPFLKGKVTMGMYESWEAVIGSILQINGIGGFLGNLTEFYDSVSIEQESRKAFIAAWLNKFGEKPVRVNDLFETATCDDVMLLTDSKSDRSQRTRLGLEIKKLQDQVFSIDCGSAGLKTVVVEKTKNRIQNCTTWKLSVQVTKINSVVAQGVAMPKKFVLRKTLSKKPGN